MVICREDVRGCGCEPLKREVEWKRRRGKLEVVGGQLESSSFSPSSFPNFRGLLHPLLVHHSES